MVIFLRLILAAYENMFLFSLLFLIYKLWEMASMKKSDWEGLNLLKNVNLDFENEKIKYWNKKKTLQTAYLNW